MFINRNCKVEAINDRNICILKRTVVSGEEKWMPKGYYSTVKGALKGLVRLKINGIGLENLKTVEKEIDGLHKIIDNKEMENEIIKALKQRIDELEKENEELRERILDMEACR